MPEPHVVILGAGPAGVGAACQLRRQNRAGVTVVEQQPVVGGNAGSFELDGHRLDYGSHRLHPACDPVIMDDIRKLLDGDLLDRPRHGRILLRGRWIHFPLKPVDLLLRLDPGFASASLKDMALKPFRSRSGTETFASILQASLGPTICRDFYFPYARKIWGFDPEALSPIQARRRVSASSFGKLFRKVLGQVPGFRPPGSGRFYYPRQGYGQISEAYADAARAAGAEMRLGSRVTGLTPPSSPDGSWAVEVGEAGGQEVIHGDYVWSTIPITTLARCLRGDVPEAVRQAAVAIHYRAMLLIYLDLPVGQFTEYDAHYFPGADTAMTRMSEPKNYAARREPEGRTVLCAELPCTVDDANWRLSDDDLGRIIAADLAAAGIPLPAAPITVRTRRLRQAYPIYLSGYEQPFATLDAWAEGLPRLLTYGRQGLFAHDNTHHALAMAYAAAECLTAEGFDRGRWAAHREVFKTHVVED
jgi:protoporphyrinogen oxidase